MLHQTQRMFLLWYAGEIGCRLIRYVHILWLILMHDYECFFTQLVSVFLSDCTLKQYMLDIQNQLFINI